MSAQSKLEEFIRRLIQKELKEQKRKSKELNTLRIQEEQKG